MSEDFNIIYFLLSFAIGWYGYDLIKFFWKNKDIQGILGVLAFLGMFIYTF